MNVSIAFAYLKGETVQVKGAPSFTDDEWQDIPAYREPSDIYRISSSFYQFRIKPVEREVSEDELFSTATAIVTSNLFELMTPELEQKMNEGLQSQLGSDQYSFVFDGGVIELKTKDRMYLFKGSSIQ
jgi:hypothetical protein